MVSQLISIKCKSGPTLLIIGWVCINPFVGRIFVPTQIIPDRMSKHARHPEQEFFLRHYHFRLIAGLAAGNNVARFISQVIVFPIYSVVNIDTSRVGFVCTRRFAPAVKAITLCQKGEDFIGNSPRIISLFRDFFILEQQSSSSCISLG